MSNNITRVFVYGTEAELRPVPAASDINGLKKRREDEKELGQTGADILFWTEILSQSLFEDDAPLFSSPEEAMEKLTIDEISQLGDFINRTFAIPKPREDLGHYSMPLEEQEKVNGPNVQTDINTRLAADQNVSAFTGETRGVEALIESETDSRVPAKRDGLQIYRTYVKPLPAQYGGAETDFISRTVAAGQVRSGRYRRSMEDISNFFGKDSRRYDVSLQ